MTLLTVIYSLALALPLTREIAAVPASTVAVQQTTPETAFVGMCNDAGSLLQRAFAEPNDTKAAALLQSGMAPLLKRKQALQPTFKQWLEKQSTAQREAFARRMMQGNGLTKFLMSIEGDAKTNARIEHSPALTKAIAGMTSLVYMDGM